MRWKPQWTLGSNLTGLASKISPKASLLCTFAALHEVSIQRHSANAKNARSFLRTFSIKCGEAIKDRRYLLAGVKLDDELLVDLRVDLGTLRDAGHGAFHFLAIHFEPVRIRNCLGEIKHAECELLGGRLGADLDLVARLHLKTCDIDAVTVHEYVAVIDHLACGLAGIAEACAVADVIETALKKLEQDDTSDATAAGCFLIVSAELLLEDAVLETELLFFTKSDGVLRLLLTACADAVLAWWEIAALQRFGRAEKGYAEAAGDFGAGTCVTCHVSGKVSV